MSNPFTCYFNGQPNMPHPPQMTVTATKSNNCMPITITFLIIGIFIIMSLAVISTFSVEASLIEEDFHPKRRIAKEIIRIENKEEKDYKNFTAPKSGILKLSKGTVSQVHHAIKEDSVIILSRKSIDGRAGSFLSIKEIVPNKKFTVNSTDDVGAVEEEDCGEIYFQIM